MQMIFEFALMVSASLLSLMAGYMIAKRLPNLTKPAAVIGFSLLSLSVLPRLFPAYFHFLFPSHFAVEVLLAVAFLFSGVLVAGYSDTGFRKIIQGILAPLVVYFILFPSACLAFHSDYIKSLDYEVRDGVTIQSSYFGCVPSSISTTLRHYGLEYTEGELAYALHTTTMGTDYSRIPRVVKEFAAAKSLKAEFIRTSLEELRRSNKPAVLYVYAGRISHATALLGFDGGEVILGEPLEGIKRIKTSEFQEQTRWTKLATIISEQS